MSGVNWIEGTSKDPHPFVVSAGMIPTGIIMHVRVFHHDIALLLMFYTQASGSLLIEQKGCAFGAELIEKRLPRGNDLVRTLGSQIMTDRAASIDLVEEIKHISGSL